MLAGAGALVGHLPGHGSRRDERTAQADWLSALNPPAQAGWTAVKTSPGGAPMRVLYNGRVWLTHERVALWRPAPEPEDMASRLLSNERDGLKDLLRLQVDAAQDEEKFVLAELARMEIDVEVVRLYEPGKSAQGLSSGRILAASQRYAAQAIGPDGVLIVEQNRLERRVQAGETVSLAFDRGRARVFSGMAYEVNVRGGFLTKEQAGWLRRCMLDALSHVDGAADRPDLMREALRHALTETARTYAIDSRSMANANIKLSVTDPVKISQKVAQDDADRRAGIQSSDAILMIGSESPQEAGRAQRNALLVDARQGSQ